MNDLIDRDHRDDDIRALLADARAAAPDPASWNDVVERRDRGRGRPRRGAWAVAAAVIFVGLLGLVAALQLRGDTGEIPADTPAETDPSVVPTTDLLVDLSSGDWVVPTELPDGYDVVVGVASAGNDRLPGSVTIGGDDVADVHVSSFEDASTDELPGEPIAVGGAVWSLSTTVDDVSGDATLSQLERRAGSRLVNMSTLGSANDLVEIAEHLTAVPANDLDIPIISPDGPFTTVATLGDATLSANGAEGYYCLQIEQPRSGRTASCGVTTKPDAPIADWITSGEGEGSITVGVAEGTVARIEFLRPGGTSVVVEPTDESGQFDDRFWIAEGPLTGDRAIVTYDDGSTVTVEQSLPGGMWAIVDDTIESTTPPVETVPPETVSIDRLAELNPGDWVIPDELPDGYDTVIALDVGPDAARLIVSGEDVVDIHVNVRTDDEATVVEGDPVGLGGATWSAVDNVDEGSGEIRGRRVERRVGGTLITITAAGGSDDLFDVADSLRPVEPAATTIPVLTANGPFTRALLSGDVTVEVRGESGFYCVRVLTASGITSTGCGSTTKPVAPIVTAMGMDGPDGLLTAGVAQSDVARIEFPRPDGDSVLVEPADESGDFEDRFWVAEGVDFEDDTADRAIVTYEDGTTATVERQPFDDMWRIVDAP